MEEAGVDIRFLGPEGAEGFTRLVRRCYGDSYDAAWVYDPDAIGLRGTVADAPPTRPARRGATRASTTAPTTTTASWRSRPWATT